MALAKGNDLMRAAPERTRSGRVLLIEDFRHPRHTVWNDGRGFTMIDNDVSFAGLPSLRIDTGSQVSAANPNPLRTAVTTGVIAKRRIHDGFRARIGTSFWFRMTSLNLTSNTLFSHSIYNRTGAQAKHFRVWMDPSGNNLPMHARILNGAATAAANGGTPTNPSGTAVYSDAVTSILQNGAGTHTYDPPTGRMDLAGGWHHLKTVVDFATGEYVSLQLDGEVADLSASGPNGVVSYDVTDTSGFAGMHISWEFSASTSTPRFVNIANVVVTLED